MKRHILLIFVLILLCGIMGCGGTVLPSRNFKATKLVSGTDENLNDIWKNYDYGNLYIVGDNGVILSSSEPETEWTIHASPINANLYDIAGDSGIYYAVGKDSAGKNYILKYDGYIWSILESETEDLADVIDTFYGIDYDDWEKKLVVVGAGGWGIYDYDKHEWETKESLTDCELRKVNIDGNSMVFSFTAIGTDETGDNIIYKKYTNSSLKEIVPELEGQDPYKNVKINDFISEYWVHEEVYVGDQGTILIRDKETKKWRQVPSGTTENLNGVAFMYFNNSKLEMLIAGDNGTLIFYDGKSCSKVNSGTNVNLNGVCKDGLSYFVAGDNGTILYVRW